jgi:predicted PurR-regulated permease PerM
MSKNISLKSLNFLPMLRKLYTKYGGHAVFGAVMLVLLVYVFVVARINSLANAEPSADQQITVTNSIPHIDPKTINQIQNLENNNTEVKSLFDQSRNNPFQDVTQ